MPLDANRTGTKLLTKLYILIQKLGFGFMDAKTTDGETKSTTSVWQYFKDFFQYP
jgi:hypothetical protein